MNYKKRDRRRWADRYFTRRLSVALEYNGFGQIAADRQSHAGAVAGGTPAVAITYPDGRVLGASYGSEGSPDDLIGRVASLAVSGEGVNLAGYLYMGVASRVQTYYPTPDARMRLFGSAGSGDPYTSLDRFGRLTEVLWEDASASAALDKFDYGYDRASNRTWRENLVLTSGEDVAFALPSCWDRLYFVDAPRLPYFSSTEAKASGTPKWLSWARLKPAATSSAPSLWRRKRTAPFSTRTPSARTQTTLPLLSLTP